MINVRGNTFETNSSSTHAIIMCTDEDYKKLLNGYYLIRDRELITHEEAFAVIFKNSENYYSKEELEKIEQALNDNDYDDFVTKVLADCDIKTFDDWGCDYEGFHDTLKLSDGQVVHAFGYYGYDC